MIRKPVESSNIKSIGYDPTNRTLEVEFNSGGIFQYSPITNEAYNMLISAESIGSYFHKNIRNNDLVKTEKMN